MIKPSLTNLWQNMGPNGGNWENKTESPAMWFPTVEYINELFRDQIASPVLLNRAGLTGTLDKVKYGLPFKPTLSIWEQVTILFEELVINHYFMDGNKRIGILLAFLFLAKNGYTLNPPVGEIYNFTMEVAQTKLTSKEITLWFRKYTIKGTEK